MNPLTKVAVALRDVLNHPLNRGRRIQSVLEYGFVQIAARMVPGDVCVEFPNGTRLLVPPRMKGAAHYIAPKMFEFEEMAFATHFLRPEDLFVDVGANLGAFTILASAVAGARSVAFEPVPATFDVLSRNIALNGVQDRARAVCAALGRSESTVNLSMGLGTENRVITGHSKQSVPVRLTTLDAEFASTPPTLLKVDVEGFETEVFAGAAKTLTEKTLIAMIVERNGLGRDYGFDEEKLHQQLRDHGFLPFTYDAFSRALSATRRVAPGNIIYVRDVAAVDRRLRTAQPFTLDDVSV